jgi:Pilus assembly protein, PilO
VKRKLPRRAVPVLLGVGLLLVALIGWFAVVSPQRSHAKRLQAEIDSTRSQVLVLRAAQNEKRPTEQLVKVADLFRLSKAVPDEVRMPDIILELSKVAGQAGIAFDSISPGPPVAQAGYEVLPVNVVFQGNYFTLSDVLYRLRNLVEVHNGNLVSTGRLFDIDQVAFQQGGQGFPTLQASLTIDAFVYTGLPDPSATTSTTPTGSTTTTTTDLSSAAESGGTS